MKQAGFHLIELLIVLSIIGILLGYALPNYSAHLITAERLIAKTALLQLAGNMEAYFTEHNTYEGANFNTLKSSELVAKNHYRLVIQTLRPSYFKLAAIPQENQQDTQCSSLLLDSRGEKQSSGWGKLEDCW